MTSERINNLTATIEIDVFKKFVWKVIKNFVCNRLSNRIPVLVTTSAHAHTLHRHSAITAALSSTG